MTVALSGAASIGDDGRVNRRRPTAKEYVFEIGCMVFGGTWATAALVGFLILPSILPCQASGQGPPAGVGCAGLLFVPPILGLIVAIVAIVTTAVVINVIRPRAPH
jgi:hypothetical protein